MSLIFPKDGNYSTLILSKFTNLKKSQCTTVPDIVQVFRDLVFCAAGGRNPPPPEKVFRSPGRKSLVITLSWPYPSRTSVHDVIITHFMCIALCDKALKISAIRQNKTEGRKKSKFLFLHLISIRLSKISNYFWWNK